MSTRRGLLAGLTASTALAAIPASANSNPDAELIATCAAFDALENAYIASWDDAKEGTPEWDAIEDKQALIQEAQLPLVARLVELRAVTLAGHIARARTFILWEGEDPTGDVNSSYINERMLGALLRDLVAGSAGA